MGHFVLFLSRLSFLLATTLFSFVSLQHLTPKTPFARYILLLAGLFCFSATCRNWSVWGNPFAGKGRSLIHRAHNPEIGLASVTTRTKV